MNSTAPLFTFRPPPPPGSVFPFLALFVLHLLSPQKMDAENPFRTTNQIILYCHFPSPLCHSLPFPLHPPHSITLPSSSPCLLLSRSPCPSQNRIYSVVRAGWGLSPTLICNSRGLPAQFSEKVGTEYFRHTSLVHLVLAHKTCPPTTSHLCCAALMRC